MSTATAAKARGLRDGLVTSSAMRLSRPLLLIVLLGAGCTADKLAPLGSYCHSLSDCNVGLICFEERCSDDLSAIAGDAPEVVDTDAAAQLADAGLDAGDAAAPLADAGSPAEAGAPDAGTTATLDAGTRIDASVERDASVPDAGVPDARVEDARVVEDAGAQGDAASVDAG